MAITKATASSIAPAAKGDLVVGSATNDAAVLGVGSNDQVLTADSSTSTGLKWATAAGGGMTLLSTTTLSGSSTTISSISGSYTDLQIVATGIDLNTGDDLFIRLNGDTGSNYYFQFFKNSQGTVTGGSNVASSLFLGSAGATADWNVQGLFKIDIPRYAAVEYHQIITFNRSFYSPNHLNYQMMGVFNSTAAITSITILTAGGATFDAGTVYVYGVK